MDPSASYLIYAASLFRLFFEPKVAGDTPSKRPFNFNGLHDVITQNCP
jgi:hypothetical protein